VTDYVTFLVNHRPFHL